MRLKSAKYFGVVIVALFVAGLMTSAFGQQVNDKSTVISTVHDIPSSGGSCTLCHVSHNSARGQILM